MVRKLKGPVKKETKEERRQRRKENVEAKGKVLTVAVPVLILAFLVAVILLYLKTRST